MNSAPDDSCLHVCSAQLMQIFFFVFVVAAITCRNCTGAHRTTGVELSLLLSVHADEKSTPLNTITRHTASLMNCICTHKSKSEPLALPGSVFDRLDHRFVPMPLASWTVVLVKPSGQCHNYLAWHPQDRDIEQQGCVCGYRMAHGCNFVSMQFPIINPCSTLVANLASSQDLSLTLYSTH